MRNIDGKFSTDGTKIFNTVSGEEIPADEPLFLLRGRDALAVKAIKAYLIAAIVEDCNDLHVAGIEQVKKKFKHFAEANPERMKEPGVTRHIKLDDDVTRESVREYQRKQNGEGK